MTTGEPRAFGSQIRFAIRTVRDFLVWLRNRKDSR